MNEGAGLFLIFRAGDLRYALPLEAVAEIAEPLPEYPIPRAPAFVRGAVNVHGTLVAVMDLASFLGLGETRPSRSLVVLNSPGTALALVAEQVEKIAGSLDLCGEQPAVDEPLVAGTLELADGPVRLLAIDPLLEAVAHAMAR
ncbi:MAG TPA: chemotaxis protein CheW [Geobacteraceae bacterium]